MADRVLRDDHRLLKWLASRTAHRVGHPMRMKEGGPFAYRAACGEPCRTFVSADVLNYDVIHDCNRRGCAF